MFNQELVEMLRNQMPTTQPAPASHSFQYLLDRSRLSASNTTAQPTLAFQQNLGVPSVSALPQPTFNCTLQQATFSSTFPQFFPPSSSSFSLSRPTFPSQFPQVPSSSSHQNNDLLADAPSPSILNSPHEVSSSNQPTPKKSRANAKKSQQLPTGPAHAWTRNHFESLTHSTLIDASIRLVELLKKNANATDITGEAIRALGEVQALRQANQGLLEEIGDNKRKYLEKCIQLDAKDKELQEEKAAAYQVIEMLKGANEGLLEAKRKCEADLRDAENRHGEQVRALREELASAKGGAEDEIEKLKEQMVQETGNAQKMVKKERAEWERKEKEVAELMRKAREELEKERVERKINEEDMERRRVEFEKEKTEWAKGHESLELKKKEEELEQEIAKWVKKMKEAEDEKKKHEHEAKKAKEELKKERADKKKKEREEEEKKMRAMEDLQKLRVEWKKKVDEAEEEMRRAKEELARMQRSKESDKDGEIEEMKRKHVEEMNGLRVEWEAEREEWARSLKESDKQHELQEMQKKHEKELKKTREEWLKDRAGWAKKEKEMTEVKRRCDEEMKRTKESIEKKRLEWEKKEKEAEEVKRRDDEEAKTIRWELERKREDLENEQNEVEEKRMRNEEEMKMIREELEKKRDDLEKKEQEYDEQMKMEMRELDKVRARREQREKDVEALKKELEVLKIQHEEVLRRLRMEWEKEREEWARILKESDKGQELQETQRKHEEELRRTREEWLKERASWMKKNKEVESKRTKELQNLEAQTTLLHEQQMQSLRNELNAAKTIELEELTRRNEDEVAMVNRTYETSIQNLRNEIGNLRKETDEAKLWKLSRKHGQELEQLQRFHDTQLSVMGKSKDEERAAEVREMAKKHEEEMSELRKRMDTIVAMDSHLENLMMEAIERLEQEAVEGVMSNLLGKVEGEELKEESRELRTRLAAVREEKVELEASIEAAIDRMRMKIVERLMVDILARVGEEELRELNELPAELREALDEELNKEREERKEKSFYERKREKRKKKKDRLDDDLRKKMKEEKEKMEEENEKEEKNEKEKKEEKMANKLLDEQQLEEKQEEAEDEVQNENGEMAGRLQPNDAESSTLKAGTPCASSGDDDDVELEVLEEEEETGSAPSTVAVAADGMPAESAEEAEDSSQFDLDVIEEVVFTTGKDDMNGEVKQSAHTMDDEGASSHFKGATMEDEDTFDVEIDEDEGMVSEELGQGYDVNEEDEEEEDRLHSAPFHDIASVLKEAKREKKMDESKNEEQRYREESVPYEYTDDEGQEVESVEFDRRKSLRRSLSVFDFVDDEEEERREDGRKSRNASIQAARRVRKSLLDDCASERSSVKDRERFLSETSVYETEEDDEEEWKRCGNKKSGKRKLKRRKSEKKKEAKTAKKAKGYHYKQILKLGMVPIDYEDWGEPTYEWGATLLWEDESVTSVPWANLSFHSKWNWPALETYVKGAVKKGEALDEEISKLMTKDKVPFTSWQFDAMQEL